MVEVARGLVGWWGNRGGGNGDQLQTTERPSYVLDHISTDDSVTGFALWTEAFNFPTNSLISRPLASWGHPFSGARNSLCFVARLDSPPVVQVQVIPRGTRRGISLSNPVTDVVRSLDITPARFTARTSLRERFVHPLRTSPTTASLSVQHSCRFLSLCTRHLIKSDSSAPDLCILYLPIA